MALETMGDHLCVGTPEKVDLPLGILPQKLFTHFWSIFEHFLVHFGLPGIPGMALGTLSDHLCAGTP